MMNRITTTSPGPVVIPAPTPKPVPVPKSSRRFRACTVMVSLTPRQIASLREIDPQLELPELVSLFLDAMLDDLPADVDTPIPFDLAEGGVA